MDICSDLLFFSFFFFFFFGGGSCLSFVSVEVCVSVGFPLRFVFLEVHSFEVRV